MEFCGKDVVGGVYLLLANSGKWVYTGSIRGERCAEAEKGNPDIQFDSIMCLECAAKNGIVW